MPETSAAPVAVIADQPAPTLPAKKPLFLSASRIDLFMQCSQRYAARYLWKLPDAGNDGSRRGSTCHEVLELLQKPRHRHLYNAAIQRDTCQEVPVLWRYVLRVAKRFLVNDPVNLQMIDEFLMVGLKWAFFGPKGTKQIEVEREFTITVHTPDGRRFNVRGFIDRVAHVEDVHGVWLDCGDFKSSKNKFDDADGTIQSQVYQLALRYLYPHIQRRAFHYLFLRFPRVPRQDVTPMTDIQLDGLEWQLTDIQAAVEAFTLDNSADNLLAFSGDQNMIRKICGREGVKADGSPAWICPARRPQDYHVIVDDTGEIVTSGTLEEMEAKVDAAQGQRIEERRYPGCAAFYAQSGRSRNFQ